MNLYTVFKGKSDFNTVQLVRAVLSSVLAFAVDFGTLVLLVEAAHVHYIISATIGFVVGTTITYLLSIYWIFARRNVQRKSAEYGVFIAVGVVGVLVNDGLLWFFTDVLGIYYMLSRMLSASAVFFWNFFARKRLLFK